jgi:SAM-dependent methyltransferase
MCSFTTLANREGTDKGTLAGGAHGYSLVYDMVFAPYRKKPDIQVLEMGLAIGGPELDGEINRKVTSSPSLNVWLQYFKDSRVVGFDISDFSQIKNDRFTFVRGDSGSRESLEKLLELDRNFDIILDDASHASYHQQLGLSVLFDALKPGGLYIIEDLSWQPAKMEKELPEVLPTAKMLSELLVTGSCPTTAAIDKKDARSIEKSVAGIWVFEESYLNAVADGFNRRNGLPVAKRLGWRGKNSLHRLLSPYFWLFSGRRFAQGLAGSEAVNWQSVKLAILQKSPLAHSDKPL